MVLVCMIFITIAFCAFILSVSILLLQSNGILKDLLADLPTASSSKSELRFAPETHNTDEDQGLLPRVEQYWESNITDLKTVRDQRIQRQ
jgi:hypothetical protein